MSTFPLQEETLFDAHCHLQDERLCRTLSRDLAEARVAAVDAWSCCGVMESDWHQVADLAEAHPGVVPSFGLHPWYVAERTTTWLNTLTALLEAHPEAGVGEIGLDHALRERDDADQESVFRSQLDLARALHRPVTIHCRRAWGALMETLQPFGTFPDGFVVHSYSGAAELIAPLSALGAFFSFSGSVTFTHNRRAHRAVAAVPPERLLIETDAPDIPPMAQGKPPERGSVNRPVSLVLTLAAVAAHRGDTRDRVAMLTRANANRLFRQEG